MHNWLVVLKEPYVANSRYLKNLGEDGTTINGEWGDIDTKLFLGVIPGTKESAIKYVADSLGISEEWLEAYKLAD